MLLQRNFKTASRSKLLLLLAFVFTNPFVHGQSPDKPAKKGDAFSVNFYFDIRKEDIAKKYGFSFTGTPQELAHYKVLLNHVKNSDSLTVSKLPLADKYLVLGVRKYSDIGDIWAMDETKLAEFIIDENLDYPLFLKEITLGKELFVASSSDKTQKTFKADLLYKGEVIEKSAVVMNYVGDTYSLPMWDFRSTYFSQIVAPAIKSSGKSEDEYLQTLINALPSSEKTTPIWHADKSMEYYSSGELRSVTPYKNGKINGTQNTYFADGGLESTADYINGVVSGSTKRYYENGKLESTRLVVGNKATRSTYSEEGVLLDVCVTETNEEGYQLGLIYCKMYYPNGILEREGGYGNFGGEGNWKFYDEAGKLTSEQEFGLGRPSGKGKTYYPDGKLKSEVVYFMGNLESEKKY